MAEYIDLDMQMKVWRTWGNSYKTASTTLREFFDINKISYNVADVVPVRHGRWEKKQVFGVKETSVEELQSAFCPVCHRYLTTPYSYNFTHYNYCPNCGAAMDQGG